MKALKKCPACKSDAEKFMGYDYGKVGCKNESCNYRDRPIYPEDWNSHHDHWINVHDKKPYYGQPVLIKLKGVVQNDTYFLDGSDDSLDWFELNCNHVDDIIKSEFSFFVKHDTDVLWMILPN